MRIEDIARELYGLAPEEFTASRNARAKEVKASGEGELAAVVLALRKPTVGAWLLNRLVRQHRGEVDKVFDLGIRLRAAQGTLGVAELRALGEQRRRLTSALAQQAAGIGHDAGRRVSAQVIAAVEETLRSAMVDPDAGAALATGLLVDTFSSTGLERVDLTRVVALGGVAVDRPARVTSGPPSEGGAAAKQRERAIISAQGAVEEAERAVRAAREESEEARRLAAEARRRREDLQSELDGARRQVEDLEQRVATATEADDAAGRAAISATGGERTALESAERARRSVDALLSPRPDRGWVPDEAAARLHEERAGLTARVSRLADDMTALIAASRDSNADDEHDPEGQTIAFERSQLSAVTSQARDHLREIDAALERLAAGTYGVCDVCRRPIDVARLEARPTARTCVRHA